MRTEKDSFGNIKLPADALYGAQTQRSLTFFAIGEDILPWGMVRALVAVKQACAAVNLRKRLLDEDIAALIRRACDELLAAGGEQRYRAQFPVRVWQTGSGTQSNMNVNEVIANLANQYAGSAPGSNQPVHPNDHVNRSQSSNDVFPTAMHLHALEVLETQLLPAIEAMFRQLNRLELFFSERLIAGRTHMMDALPLTLGQVFGAYRQQIAAAQDALLQASAGLTRLAIGGTAVGTGANAPSGFDRDVCVELAAIAGRDVTPHPNKFAALSGQDDLLATAQALARLAAVLNKIANDIRLLASGPHTAIGELRLPANEPGSSIMPGKVNPTQCEALAMVCIQVSTQVHAIEMATAAGQLQLNTYRPLMMHNFSQAVRLLADAQQSFAAHCLAGIEVNAAVLDSHLDNNLMLVTYAVPELGYDNASKVARYAEAQRCNIYQAAEQLGVMAADQLRKLVAERITESLANSPE
ncbi:MAG: class II fumarate hydratase [Pseudomonadales bacterium]